MVEMMTMRMIQPHRWNRHQLSIQTTGEQCRSDWSAPQAIRWQVPHDAGSGPDVVP